MSERPSSDRAQFSLTELMIVITAACAVFAFHATLGAYVPTLFNSFALLMFLLLLFATVILVPAGIASFCAKLVLREDDKVAQRKRR